MYQCETDYFKMWNICSNLNMVEKYQILVSFKGFGARSSNIKKIKNKRMILKDMNILN